MLDIVIIAILILSALCALKKLVRTVLIIAIVLLLLCVCCGLWAKLSPTSLDDSGLLFPIFASLGMHLFSLFK